MISGFNAGINIAFPIKSTANGMVPASAPPKKAVRYFARKYFFLLVRTAIFFKYPLFISRLSDHPYGSTQISGNRQ